MRARLALLLAGSVALGGCAYGFGNYGSYGGLSVGIGSGYGGYGSCYDPYYGGYGYGGYGSYGCSYGGYGAYGYGSPYGRYDNYYYPGTGIYVYDRNRRAYRWSDRQRRHWTHQRDRAVTSNNSTTARHSATRENWSGFNRRDRTRDSNESAGRHNRKAVETRPQ